MATITEVMFTDLAHNGDFLITPTGDLDVISGLANLKQALFHRLITEPGSLIHRPLYGVGIKRFQNAPNSVSQQEKLALRIQENFARDPRVEEVTSIAIEPNPDPHLVLITVKVKAVGYDEAVMEFIPFGFEVD